MFGMPGQWSACRLHFKGEVIQHRIHVERKSADFFGSEMQRYARSDLPALVGQEKLVREVVGNVPPAQHRTRCEQRKYEKRSIEKEAARITHAVSGSRRSGS